MDQISTNTLRYTMCCAPIVYMFVYILIGAHIVPLRCGSRRVNCFTMLLLNIFITNTWPSFCPRIGGINEMMMHIKKTNMLVLKLR